MTNTNIAVTPRRFFSNEKNLIKWVLVSINDYSRFKFHGCYNFSTCTVLVIYDYILENF